MQESLLSLVAVAALLASGAVMSWYAATGYHHSILGFVNMDGYVESYIAAAVRSPTLTLLRRLPFTDDAFEVLYFVAAFFALADGVSAYRGRY